jgi:hypothetical protein
MFLQILTIISISYLFIHAEPMILLKRWVGFQDEQYDNFSKSKKFIHKLINCWMCSTFWIGIIYSLILGCCFQDIFIISVISSFIAGIIDNKL